MQRCFTDICVTVIRNTCELHRTQVAREIILKKTLSLEQDNAHRGKKCLRLWLLYVNVNWPTLILTTLTEALKPVTRKEWR